MTIEFTEDNYYSCPKLTAEMWSRAEGSLGVCLPDSYHELLLVKNGGIPLRRCFPTDFLTSWSADYFQVSAILGVGCTRGIDAVGTFGSRYMIDEWGYPDIGIVICDMPSGGHDAVMLDYSKCGSRGEPSVAYVDEDRIPKTIASSFEDFIHNLRHCAEFIIQE